MTFRILTTATMGLALFLAAPAWATSEATDPNQAPRVEQKATTVQYTVQARTGDVETAGPTLYRVGARTDGHFPFAYPFAGPPQVMPLLPVGLISGSGLGFAGGLGF